MGSANKAKVAIANRLARVIFKVLGGAPFKDQGYMRGDPAAEQIRRLVAKLKVLGVDIKHVNHQLIADSTTLKTVRTINVDSSGKIQEELKP